MDVSGRTFLVTGGASGLGAASVRALVAAGGQAVIADTDTEGASLAEELGDAVTFVQTDVTDADSVQQAVDRACAQFGTLHGVIGCAGIVNGARMIGKDGAPFPLETFRKAVDVNLVGMFNVVRLAAAAMAGNEPNTEGERGVVVMTASIAAFDGQVGQAAYAASKAGVAGLTLPLARDLAKQGIRVVTIAPGIFETPMMSGMPEKVRDSLSAQTPFPPRLGRPAEFADLAMHALHNTMLNGEVIRLDGAVRMGPR
jgi:NAD(P)-dependent dehydrogenase (short-subunit alcohol dehydrogenase family)